MKAPNKIYLASEYVDNKTLPVGVTKKQVFEKDVCYIRKDALLEWARIYKEEADRQIEIKRRREGIN